jgi:hypothetical protein
MYIYIYTCKHTYIYAHTYLHKFTSAHIHTHTYIHTHIKTQIHLQLDSDPAQNEPDNETDQTSEISTEISQEETTTYITSESAVIAREKTTILEETQNPNSSTETDHIKAPNDQNQSDRDWKDIEKILDMENFDFDRIAKRRNKVVVEEILSISGSQRGALLGMFPCMYVYLYMGEETRLLWRRF